MLPDLNIMSLDILCNIIQQIRKMPVYGYKAIFLRHPYITDILLNIRWFRLKFRPKTYNLLPNYIFSNCKIRFVDNLLNYKPIILLNLAEYRPILVSGEAIFRAISQDNCFVCVGCLKFVRKSRSKMRFVDNLLNNKTFIPLILWARFQAIYMFRENFAG